MNNKFLLIVCFFQSYLFAADIPHERPVDNEEKIQFQSASLSFDELKTLIKNGDTQTLKDILNSNDNKISQIVVPLGMTPLHIAAILNNIKIAELLLESGYAEDFLKQDDNGKTPLHLAAQFGSVEIAKLLLDDKYTQYAEKFLKADNRGANALHIAAATGKIEIVKLLLESQYAKQLLQPTKDTRITILHVAAAAGHVELAKLLLESKYAQEFLLKPTNNGKTAFDSAIQYDKVEIAKLLLESNYAKKFLEPDNFGFTALHTAATAGKIEIVKLLLDDKYSQYTEQILQPTKDGCTALYTAAQYGQVDVTEFLLNSQYAQDFLQPNNNGFTALHTAAEYGQVGIAKLLLESNYAGKFLEPDNFGFTALYVAVEYDQVDIVKLLLEKKYSQYTEQILNASNDGWTALHLAARLGKVDIIKLFLDSKNLIFIRKLLSNQTNFLKDVKYSYVWQLIYRTLLENAYKNAKTQDDILEAQENTKLQIVALAHGLDGSLEQQIFEENFLKQLHKDLMPLANQVIINNATCFATPTYKTYKMEIADCKVCDEKDKQLYVCLAGDYACTNKLCIDCINDYIDICSKNKTELPICSNNKCRKEICPLILESIGCDENTIVALKHNIFSLYNSKNPLWRPCPTTDCVGGVNLKSDDHYFACSICDFKGCLDCSEDHHGKCDIYLEDLESRFKLYNLGKMSPPPNPYSEYNKNQDEFYHGRYRMCPGCGILSERIDGCNFIKCSKCAVGWHWNKGIAEDILANHDWEKSVMHEDYEKTLKDKGFLKEFDVLKKTKAE